jgi:protein SCO1/2
VQTASDQSIADRIKQAVAANRPARLIRLLQEGAPVYKGKSTNEVVRIRGYILATFQAAGLPDAALPYVLEELENGKHPYLIAGAARGLRGRKTPFVQAVPYLLKAINNLSHGDDAISFRSLTPDFAEDRPTSALGEILETLSWYGPFAQRYIRELKDMLEGGIVNLSSENRLRLARILGDLEKDKRVESKACCRKDKLSLSAGNGEWPGKIPAEIPATIKMEDHGWSVTGYADFFTGKPAIAVFFYTRCDNPNKCSLTITRLAGLQQLLSDRGLEGKVRIAAITYDPIYDTPERLRNYCESRQLILNEDCRSFRVIEGMGALRAYFQLGVNYIGSIVNKHRVELYLTDRNGRIRRAFTRLQWDEEKVLEVIQALESGESTMGSPGKDVGSWFRNVLQTVLSVFLFLAVAFFPKCPACWAAYLSALGISGLTAMSLQPWMIPLIFVGMGVNLFLLWCGCRKRNGLIPFQLSATGMLLIILSGIWWHWKGGTVAGLVLVLLGSALNSLPYHLFHRLRLAIGK